MDTFLKLWLCFWLALPLQAATLIIHFPILPAKGDPQLRYMLALLQLACDKAEQHCVLRAGPSMVQGRAILELQRKQSRIDLMWSMTSRDRERVLIPVRLPLYKGLIGWRIALLPPGQQQALAGVRNLADLARFTAGQEHDWPDTVILQAAGLPVMNTPDYESLFTMLSKHRFDYFPRSVIEVWHEQRSHSELKLPVDPYLLIHYPAAFYFFVSPHQPQLARMLERGLTRAVDDGSFDALFRQHNQAALDALQQGKRRVLSLPNPLLPPETPLARKSLWYPP